MNLSKDSQSIMESDYTAEKLEEALKWYLKGLRSELTRVEKSALTKKISLYTRIAKEKPAVVAGYLAISHLEKVLSDPGSKKIKGNKRERNK